MKDNLCERLIIGIILVLAAFVYVLPSQASLYQDNFTAQITQVQNGPSGSVNPFGLSLNQTFSWSITYDTATVVPGGATYLNGYYPNNDIWISIPRSGTSPLILTKVNDDLYGTGKWDGAYFSMPSVPTATTGAIDDLFFYSSYGFVTNLGITGYLTVDFNYQGGPALYFDPATVNGTYSVFKLNLGISDFDPTTDRQVVPIPGALLLMGSGLAALAVFRRQSR